MASTGSTRQRVLAVASGGGHWEQLMLLRPALAEFDMCYAITNPALAERDGVETVHALPDANRNNWFAAIHCLWASYRLVRKVKPDVIVTTGALPGLMVLVAGRFAGARTIWIDSIANSQRLSMSGKWASRVADLSLTQWPHLASAEGPYYRGALL